ncbi:hypothetical protein pEaSNUABM22_00285 [Erwinia phage pEa_SNUABM_22]|uniref:Uncharacterized protein n=1 Tax=Erwinia phage pEa_SNUABM_22 TaxID=2869549 RepID=A0AAE8XRW1_9CAUD|nr:hypothetical protein MPK63_gp284 [Erwinia phage pEa_SNUABM_22]UAW96772.1 hypothetical protein pEaSNUABM22_00285 [Erwinia phage pEa_SNUABM_22]
MKRIKRFFRVVFILPTIFYLVCQIIGIKLWKVVLWFRMRKSDKELAYFQHEADVLEALLNLSTDKCARITVLFAEYKKPRGLSHNLVYLWPKAYLHKVLNSKGVAVGPVPNYTAAFTQFLDKVQQEKKA